MSARRAVFAAAAAAVAGALLLGGNVTYAAWSDSANSETTTITAGTLEAEIKLTGPSSVN
ncbi:MAG: SipW-dependent-type signal peptide-containing protein, partial [Brevibacterium sp.]